MRQLIDIITTLVKGGKPLRGHDEKIDRKHRGLFLDIIELFGKYSPDFKTYLEEASKNCTYLSNRIQNNILQAMSNVIMRQIAEELKGMQFSLMAYETRDVSHHEQLAVAFRYHPLVSFFPVERFVVLQRVKSTDSQNLFNEIHQISVQMNLEWNQVLSVSLFLNKDC